LEQRSNLDLLIGLIEKAILYQKENNDDQGKGENVSKSHPSEKCDDARNHNRLG